MDVSPLFAFPCADVIVNVGARESHIQLKVAAAEFVFAGVAAPPVAPSTGTVTVVVVEPSVLLGLRVKVYSVLALLALTVPLVPFVIFIVGDPDRALVLVTVTNRDELFVVAADATELPPDAVNADMLITGTTLSLVHDNVEAAELPVA